MTSAPAFPGAAELMAKLATTWTPDGMRSDAAKVTWDELFSEDAVLIEPESLPHGGRHEGRVAFQAAQAAMAEMWEQTIEDTQYWICSPQVATLRITIRWKARSTGKTVVLPMIDQLHCEGGRFVLAEAYVFDTKALLDTLQ